MLACIPSQQELKASCWLLDSSHDVLASENLLTGFRYSKQSNKNLALAHQRMDDAIHVCSFVQILKRYLSITLQCSYKLNESFLVESNLSSYAKNMPSNYRNCLHNSYPRCKEKKLTRTENGLNWERLITKAKCLPHSPRWTIMTWVF